MAQRVPPYCDDFIDAHERGFCGDHMHLGAWNAPPSLAAAVRPGEFEKAQARLATDLITLLDPATHRTILDVACGLGGTLRLIDEERDGASLTGLNIDPRQIAICRKRRPATGNRFSWIVGDACALPFADETFDALLCIEAQFHFSARATFLGEARRVLKPGGTLVLSDILLSRPTMPFAIGEAFIAQVLRADYGPWPQIWITDSELTAMAAACGLRRTYRFDASAMTLPSYRTIAPPSVRSPKAWTGARVMRVLQEAGFLTYVYARFEK